MNEWRWMLGVTLLGPTLASCGEIAKPDVPETTPDGDPVTPGDPVASCDGASDGTPCGWAGEDAHCVYGACVKNSCGDGHRAGEEECDDGDEVDGDGCDARCKIEACGNGVRDLGEQCDDGNADDGDGCSAACKIEATSDAGEPIADGGETSCPSASDYLDGGTPEISVEPTSAYLGDRIKLTVVEIPGAEYVWWEEARNGPPVGAFSDENAGSPTFRCNLAAVTTLYRLAMVGEGCPPLGHSATITCSVRPLPPPDAGSPDGGGGTEDAGREPDAGNERDAGNPGSSDAGSDAGELADAGDLLPDSGTGGSPNSACLSCLEDKCSSYESLDLSGPCFLESTDGLNGPLNQPLFSQLCTDAVACSSAADSNCFLDQIGPSRCYCGDQTVDQCNAGGPLAGAPCVEEWTSATECDGIADPAARNGCVLGAFQDLSRPAGYAFFMSLCAQQTLAAGCLDECTN